MRAAIVACGVLAGVAWAADPPPVELTAEQDHKLMVEKLGIGKPRQGANGRDPNAPNAANYDESKANPFPTLPDPLLLKNGKRVTSANVWWERRRAEIVEDFDREVYGRVPANVPRVEWEVIAETREVKSDVPVVSKRIVGHVDNSSYPLVNVDIQLSLTTPANAAGPVPVIMELSFIFPPGFRFPAAMAPTGPPWQQQVLSR